MKLLGICCLFSIFAQISGQCRIALIADNEFKAYLNNTLVSSGAEYSRAFEFEVNNLLPQQLTLELKNYQGASGVFVASSSDFHSSSTFKCIKPDLLYLNGNNNTVIRNYNYNDDQWPNALEYGPFALQPWSGTTYTSIVPLATSSGKWLWTSNRGANGGNGIPQQNGDLEIVCRAKLTNINCKNTAPSGSAKIQNSGPCAGGVIVGSQFCVKLVKTSSRTWDSAYQDALNSGKNLAPVLSQEYQLAIREVMRYRTPTTTNVWIGGRYMQPRDWRWVNACCGNNQPSNVYAREQGCFNDDGTFNAIASTPADCSNKCQNTGYAALKYNDICACSPTASPNLIQSGVCPASGKMVLYRSGGIPTSWGSNQPNNLNGYQYCGAIKDDTKTLDDVDCGGPTKYRYICEVQANIDGSCKNLQSAGFPQKLELNGRCYYLKDVIYKANWYIAKQNCIEVGGNIVSIDNTNTFDAIATWVKSHTTSSHTWVGLYREAWYWTSNFAGTNGIHPIGELDYTHFADQQLANIPNWQCLYMDANYTVKATRCTDSYNYVTVEAYIPPVTTQSTTKQTNTDVTTGVSNNTPGVGASTGGSGLSTVMIALIVIIILIIIFIIIAIIVFCCCCKNKSAVAVGPNKKYLNARPIAHVPISTKLGEEESGIYVVESEQGSTTNLVADPNHFHGDYKSPRYGDGYYPY